MTETQLQKAVVQYIQLQYSDSIVISDPNGIKLTIGQAKQLKEMRLPSDGGHPDLWVFQPKGIYYGLFIELKKEGTELYKKRPFPLEWKSEHLEKQHTLHNRLRHNGYYGGFAVGFDNAKKMIDDYFKFK